MNTVSLALEELVSLQVGYVLKSAVDSGFEGQPFALSKRELLQNLASYPRT